MTLAPGDFNLASQAEMATIGEAPYEYFAALRRDAPVHWNPPPEVQLERFPTVGFWVLSKYDDVAEASKDPARFSAWENSVLWTDVKQNPVALEAQRAGLMGMDPPQHTQYRRLVQPEFTPRKIADLEPWMREQAREVIAELAQRDEAEFVFEVAAELPMILLCHMMGVPPERRAEYLRLGNDVANVEFNENFETTMLELFFFLNDLVTNAADLDEHTMLHKYLTGEVEGRTLSLDEICQFFLTLSIAGHETTRNSTAHFVRLMDEHPDQKALLLEDLEGRLPNAIEEVLRFSPPVMQFCRTTTEDVEIRGVTIPKGEKVYMSYISANRDEDVFDEPDRFDILRENASAHLAFGTGAHFCLGASLARAQLRLVLTELYTQLPDIALQGPPTPMNSVWFNGITAMPVATCPVAH
ncbi:MAG: cytochrome P450 [Acidimicrobiales bacterium]